MEKQQEVNESAAKRKIAECLNRFVNAGDINNTLLSIIKMFSHYMAFDSVGLIDDKEKLHQLRVRDSVFVDLSELFLSLSGAQKVDVNSKPCQLLFALVRDAGGIDKIINELTNAYTCCNITDFGDTKESPVSYAFKSVHSLFVDMLILETKFPNRYKKFNLIET
ncbi:MAG: hypothetical protein KF775_02250 [Cyclobacteriaceae bacterium]|nr:hypothetical protein [Cyclobacteriaceae bacterium]